MQQEFTKKKIRKADIIFLIVFFTVIITVVSVIFIRTRPSNILIGLPHETWTQYSSPEEAGYSQEMLDNAKSYYDKIGASSLMVIYNNAVLIKWGDTSKGYDSSSIREAYINALYGVNMDNENIDLDKTLSDLNIEDVPPLLPSEKEARIVDLLTNMSGVYHPAAGETKSMMNLRPKRSSSPPGTYWFHNNWDVNALSYILEKQINRDTFLEFKDKIADKIGMQDFNTKDCTTEYDNNKSKYPVKNFTLSTRDMARFGLLYLNGGKWGNEQLISSDWIEKSSSTYSVNKEFGGYGYLWWYSTDAPFVELEMYSSFGEDGQSIDILPEADMVIVTCIDAEDGRTISTDERLNLYRLILKAKTSKPKKEPKLMPLF